MSDWKISKGKFHRMNQEIIIHCLCLRFSLIENKVAGSANKLFTCVAVLAPNPHAPIRRRRQADSQTCPTHTPVPQERHSEIENLRIYMVQLSQLSVFTLEKKDLHIPK